MDTNKHEFSDGNSNHRLRGWHRFEMVDHRVSNSWLGPEKVGFGWPRSHSPLRTFLILAGKALFSSSRSLRACWRAAFVSFLELSVRCGSSTDPPAVVELGPFLPAEQGADLGDVTVRDEGVLQTLRVAPDNGAEEVVHPLQDDGMVAGEVLESQAGSVAAHGVEEHGGPEGSVRPGVLVGDGEEGREAVGGILLHARERDVQLVDESVTQLVAEDELVAPHIQDVSCEVLLRDRPRRTLTGDDLREELGEDVVGRLRKGRRPPDLPTVNLGSRVVDALGKLVRDDDLEVVG